MRILLVLFLFFQTAFCFSQHVVVANLKENIAIKGVDNPLAASVAGYPCNTVILTTSNGTIEKNSCGYFTYHPAELGAVSIKVWIKNGKKLKLMGTVPYRIHSLPLPVAFVGSYSNETISQKTLKVMGGIIAKFINTDIDALFQIVSFTTTGTRDSLQVFTTQNTGARWNEDLLKKFDDLRTEDHILFSNIVCIGPDGKEIQIQPIEFTIKD